MSDRKRRRPRRNIWSEPPAPMKPFDYEESLRPPEPEPPPVPETGVFDVVRYNTPAPDVVEVPQAEAAQPEESVVEWQEPEAPREPERAPRGRHLSHRRVVLPRGRKRGRHSAPYEPELPEVAAVPGPDLEMEPLFDPDLDEDYGTEAAVEPVAEVEPEVVPEREPVAAAEPVPEPVAEAEPKVVEDDTEADDFEWPAAPPDWTDEVVAEVEAEVFERQTPGERRGKHLAEKRVLFPRRAKPGRHSLSAPAATASPAQEIIEEEELFAEPSVTDEDFRDDAALEPLDDAEVMEDIAPFEPGETRRSRRRGRGRHLGPSRRSLFPQKTRPGRHSMKAAPPTADEVEVWDETEIEADFDEYVPDIEETAPEAVAEPELSPEPEPEPEPEPVVEVIDEEWADDVIVVDDEDPVDEFADDEALDDLEPEEPRAVAVPLPRRSRTRRRRRERVKKFVVGLLTAIVVGSLTVGASSALAPPPEDVPDKGRGAVAGGAAPVEDASTTLLYGIREEAEDRGAIWISLLSVDPESGTAAILYIPAHTAVEVPGHGLLPLGETLISGGPALMLVSAENLLGVRVDRYVELSDSDARLLFGATGPLTIDVPEDVRVSAGPNQARLIFVEGPQELSATFLSRLLFTRGLDTDDVEFGARLTAFWDSLHEAFHDDPAALGDAVRTAGPALLSDQSEAETASFFEALAAVPEEDLTLTSIPVNAISAGDSELYGTDVAELTELIERTLGTTAVSGDEVRVQVLNGNGEPGIGQEVAERLVGEGFRVILSGNARTLDYETTLIVTYDDSPEGIALAERARDLIGLGEVQVSGQQQGIVDLTIVIGKDFLRAP